MKRMRGGRGVAMGEAITWALGDDGQRLDDLADDDLLGLVPLLQLYRAWTGQEAAFATVVSVVKSRSALERT
jgi:hypothetical protein